MHYFERNKKYLRIIIMTSVHRVPNVWSYWNKAIGDIMIQHSKPMYNCWKKKLHFNDDSVQITDTQIAGFHKLYKITPAMDELRATFLSDTEEDCLSIHEQIVANNTINIQSNIFLPSPINWDINHIFFRVRMFSQINFKFIQSKWKPFH